MTLVSGIPPISFPGHFLMEKCLSEKETGGPLEEVGRLSARPDPRHPRATASRGSVRVAPACPEGRLSPSTPPSFPGTGG